MTMLLLIAAELLLPAGAPATTHNQDEGKSLSQIK